MHHIPILAEAAAQQSYDYQMFLIALIGLAITLVGMIVTAAFLYGKQFHAMENLTKKLDEYIEETRTTQKQNQGFEKEFAAIAEWRKGVDKTLEGHDEGLSQLGVDLTKTREDLIGSKVGSKAIRK